MVLLSSLLLLGESILCVSGQITTSPPSSTPTLGPSPLPLTQYSFQYPNLPEQVNPFDVGRGPQSGYNICNSTTEGPESECQTMFLNTIQDFCLWGSPTPNGVIADVEAAVVAYCSQPGHGTRLIPPGTLTAVQFIKTPGYIQVTGNFNQTGIGLSASDLGGELDPHTADFFGNPLGGLVFSNNLPTAENNSTYTQVKNWSNFVSINQFCFKACDNSITSPDYCLNTFDTEGCLFNMPASYAPNEFSVCLGDNQAQPGEGGTIPATSSCTTYSSSDLYPNTATTSSASTTGSSASHTATATKASSAHTAVIGGAVGGAVGVVCIAAITIFCRPRNNARSGSNRHTQQFPAATARTHAMLSPNPPTTQIMTTPSTSYPLDNQHIRSAPAHSLIGSTNHIIAESNAMAAQTGAVEARLSSLVGEQPSPQGHRESPEVHSTLGNDTAPPPYEE